MLEHVANEDVLAAQVNGGENLGKQLTRCTDERESLLVFVFPWCFADAHELRGRTSLSRHGLGRGSIERTLRALRDRFRELVERTESTHCAAKQLAARSPNNDARQRFTSGCWWCFLDARHRVW